MSEQKPPMVYLRGGHVCGFTVPLPPAVVERWKRGELQRVTEDGQTWPGDPWVMPGDEREPEPQDDSTGESGDASGRPKGNAAKADWAAYAVSLGACTEDEAGKLTRDQLAGLCTAPEDKAGADS